MIEIVNVKKMVSNLIEYVQKEQAQITNKEDSFLFSLFGDTEDGGFKFYDQANSLFVRDEGSPRKIKVTMEYPKSQTSLPCYVIREPGMDKGIDNSIGKTVQGIGANPYLIRDARTHSFEIMCVSLNFLESVIMSETLYALLLGSYDYLSQIYTSIEFKQSEVMAQTDLMPTPIFIRTINLVVSLDNCIPPLIDQELLGKIIFERAEIAATIDPILRGRDFSVGVESEIKGDI